MMSIDSILVITPEAANVFRSQLDTLDDSPLTPVELKRIDPHGEGEFRSCWREDGSYTSRWDGPVIERYDVTLELSYVMYDGTVNHALFAHVWRSEMEWHLWAN